MGTKIYGEDIPLPGIVLPAPGGMGGFSLVSPTQLFSSNDPRMSVWNPAGQAGRELPGFSVSAEVGFPIHGSQSGAGGLFSGGAALPTAIGTLWFTGDAAVRSDNLTAWAVPRGFSLNAGLSKRAGDILSLGIGVGGGYFVSSDPSWNLSASLGALFDIRSLGPQGSRLSVAFLGLGGPWDSYFAPTPLVALETKFIDTEKFALSLGALAAVPGFTDFTAGLGATFELGRYVSIDLGWFLSSKQISRWMDTDNSNADLFALSWPSISLRFEGASLLRAGKFGVDPSLRVKPAGQQAMRVEAAAVFSAGERDITGPVIVPGLPEHAAYSPRLLSEVVVPIAVTDESVIVSWDAAVTGPGGIQVFAGSGGDTDPGRNPYFGTLFTVKRNVPLPEKFIIPISPDLPDGAYTLSMTAADERGNQSRYSGTIFILDGTPPSAAVSTPEYRIFSPNGDGIRDVLAIEQTGSMESLWQGIIYGVSGDQVFSLSWLDSEPSSFVWDGRDNRGDIVPDGTYTYTLTARDEGGNTFEDSIRNIIVDAAPTAIALSLDGTALSTDPDSNYRNVTLVNSPARTRGLESWRFSLISDSGAAARIWEGSAENLDLFPRSIVFDGRTRDGDPVPDGTYRFKAELVYTNGDSPSALSGTFLIDSKVPAARVRASSQFLNIDRNQRVVLYHDLSAGAVWKGTIYDSQNRIIRSYDLSPEPELTIQWNGLDSRGEPVPEGMYRYSAEGTSAVGLSGKSNEVSMRVDTGGYELSLLADKDIFSALVADGRQRYLPRLSRPERAVSYELSVSGGGSGAEVRRFYGAGPVPRAIDWDGRDAFGVPVPPGSYSAVMTVRYDDGEQVVSEPVTTLVDSVPPRGSVNVNRNLFSPNGDGIYDTVEFQISGDKEAHWTAVIETEAGGLARSYSWQGLPPERLVWDGTDGSGSYFPDGSYRLRLSALDRAGNVFSAVSGPVRMDSRIPALSLTADKTAFSPNGDGFADAMNFRLIPSFTDGLSAWEITVADEGNTPVKVISARDKGETAPPQNFSWDGRTETGQAAPDGNYRIRAVFRYTKGDIAETATAPFLLDTAPPEVALSLSPNPFSPDGDGFEDELEIRITARDRSPIAGWMLTINDPGGYPFTSFSGTALPAEPFYWDGMNLNGDLVEAAQDYPYTLRVRDNLGNTAVIQGTIATDVFVLVDGDRLKIRISSIVFPPSSASLYGIDPETDARNSAILDRIAAVLTRYPAYRIRIEGHAVNLSGTEREERVELAPLSLSRAQAVMQALIERGTDRSRLEARGLGGTEPIVPHGDTASRWRNRRVEFILMR
ncbi:FlgD immunoglobulin-like domain containing protein [Breznakiella homolactica]|uniref:Gliding motility-associated C-terminal domain-containing protein n=1 Tax=Breznakiella homolactica TaxID=2798577 RepID=A0A7T7XL11_9SPIR|nr:FlgD immunoglobulin-like domain containing protein [Breznakiella homolactica]QQO08152.1 gliding motility-associated C-terminal domain-containing protein [Breznakiella homolactica]